MNKTTVARRADLKAALKQFRKGQTITLEDLALLWGVTKARFINIRATIADFPDPIGKQGNAILYEARAVLDCLLRHETRNDRAESSKSKKIARILGGSGETTEDDPLPATEMLALARAGAEVDKRLREQGLLVKFSDVQEIAQEVFGEISAFLSKLSDTIDPNGKMPTTVRSLIDASGKDALLRIYNRLNDMLTDNADRDAHPAKATRARPNRPRRPPVRREPKGRVRKRA